MIIYMDSNISKKYAFVTLKPDVIESFLEGTLIERLEAAGLKVVKRKLIRLTPEQVDSVYKEKRSEVYYLELRKFMTAGQSMCIILHVDNELDATRIAQEVKDKVRIELRQKNFEINKPDLELLNKQAHPQQDEITQVMALRNLVHVADDDKTILESMRVIYQQSELEELRERAPELYFRFTKYQAEREPTETPQELRIEKKLR